MRTHRRVSKSYVSLHVQVHVLNSKINEGGHCNLRTNLALYLVKISFSLTKR